MAKGTNSKSHSVWLGIGLVGVLLEAPNATVIRQLTFSMDPATITLLRFLIIGIAMLPFVIFAWRTFTRKTGKDVLLAGLHMTAAIYAYTLALQTGPASYVSIITLLSPILLVVFSVKLGGEKVNKRSVAGITLAAAGALLIVALPIAVGGGGDFAFYPESAAFSLVNCVTFTLALLYSKRANQNGVPMAALIGSYSWLIVGVSVAVLAVGGTIPTSLPQGTDLLLLAYSGLGVALLARALTIASYERVGASVTSALTYVGLLAAILIPIPLLGEKLSIEMVIGGVLILLGIYVIEHHKSSHHKHHRILKSQ